MSTQRIVLITGAARGIGAETARILAARGDHVVLNFREKLRRAQDLADSIAAAGGSAEIAGADLCDPDATATMVDGILARHGRLDVLVLNASGGLERGAPDGYALAINRDAQIGAVRCVLPRLASGARIVFLTSHQAHFHGRKPVPTDYEPIAVSKRAGEDALRSMIPEFASGGVGFTVVSGDMIDGTMIVRLLRRRDPGAVAARTEHGPLPTVADFASAVADATDADHPLGHTVYIGGADYLAGV